MNAALDGSGTTATTYSVGPADEPMPTTPQRLIRLLVFTSLYPNSVRPRHGVFVEERLRKLIDSGHVTARVIAPVPWFPVRSRRFGPYTGYARVPHHETRYGIRIDHPRYPVIPKYGMNLAPTLMSRAMLPIMRRSLVDDGGFDLIDSHYFYPDGVAAARLGATLGKPVVVTARGNDVTLLPHYRSPRRQILRAAGQAAAIATVSAALQTRLTELGVDPEKITVLRNGVDLDRFKPLERAAIRTRLKLSGQVWLTVGHLIERKGVHIAIQALVQFPEATLLIVGDGPEEHHLRQLAAELDVRARVRFLGPVSHDDIVVYYNAADVLIHPASREGMPNVVLEALACGTPVVAAPFAGVEEILDAPEAGSVAPRRDADAIATSWRRLRNRAPERIATRRYAERFGWEPVVDAQCALYARILETVARHAAART